jgi:hypothetical protein
LRTTKLLIILLNSRLHYNKLMLEILMLIPQLLQVIILDLIIHSLSSNKLLLSHQQLVIIIYNRAVISPNSLLIICRRRIMKLNRKLIFQRTINPLISKIWILNLMKFNKLQRLLIIHHNSFLNNNLTWQKLKIFSQATNRHL